MAKQFLNKIGLSTFLTQLEGLFATKKSVTDVKEATDPYIFEIDYENTLKFNTSFIVGDVGQFDYTTFENFVLT